MSECLDLRWYDLETNLNKESSFISICLLMFLLTFILFMESIKFIVVYYHHCNHNHSNTPFWGFVIKQLNYH